MKVKVIFSFNYVHCAGNCLAFVCWVKHGQDAQGYFPHIWQTCLSGKWRSDLMNCSFGWFVRSADCIWRGPPCTQLIFCFHCPPCTQSFVPHFSVCFLFLNFLQHSHLYLSRPAGSAGHWSVVLCVSLSQSLSLSRQGGAHCGFTPSAHALLKRKHLGLISAAGI